jgi:hypothetical protein
MTDEKWHADIACQPRWLVGSQIKSHGHTARRVTMLAV